MDDELVKYAIKKLKHKNSKRGPILKIGEGAWHTVYKIARDIEDDIVLRIKKKMAYREFQEFNEIDLITEYESSKFYYQLANTCSVTICPSYYEYYISESIVFTVESFMGEGVKLKDINNTKAFAIGEKLGDFFKMMHNQSPTLKGFGNLVWNGSQLEGRLQDDLHQVWQRENDDYVFVLNKLIHTDLELNRDILADKILSLIKKRRENQQKISLVNQDVTPENIIFKDTTISVIDPFPKLDFDIKYAGYFVFCYKFLLPAYSDAPRYRGNKYNQYKEVLSKISDGFIQSYIGNDKKLYQSLIDEYILWVLLETYEHYEVLTTNKLSSKTMLQMGDKGTIYNRLLLCVKQLENLLTD